MAIRIIRNEAGNCITFQGSTQPAYYNACLSGEVNAQDANRVNVINDLRSVPGDTKYEFFGVPYTELETAEGNQFASAAEAAQYITDNANVIATDFSNSLDRKSVV